MRTLLLLATLSLPGLPAAILFTNGAPNANGGANFTDFRVADDFTLASLQRITLLRFWTFSQSVDPPDSPTSDMPAVTWAIYANTGGAPGALLQTGTVNNLTGASAGTDLGVREIPVDFQLAAGDYFLELHAASTLDSAGSVLFTWAAADDNATLRYLLGTDLNSVPTTEVNPFLGSGLLQAAFEIEGSAPVPEPGTVGLALAGLGWCLRRSWNRRASAIGTNRP